MFFNFSVFIFNDLSSLVTTEAELLLIGGVLRLLSLLARLSRDVDHSFQLASTISNASLEVISLVFYQMKITTYIFLVFILGIKRNKI